MSANDQLFQKYGKVFPPGSILFKEGDRTREIFILQSGKVRITRRVRDVEKILDVLDEPGEFFGELSFINNRARVATAAVILETRALVIEPAIFEKMLLANSEISFRFIKKLAARLDEADTQIENLMLKDNESRITHYLLYLLESSAHQKASAEPRPINVEEMCGWLGLSKLNVLEVLDKLTAKGMVAHAGQSFTASSAEMLRRYLEFLDMKQRFGEG
jgi:CRP-like cAMP-binding protein